MINKLKINNFRNLSLIDCSFSPAINLIYGVNGSGKTSILESIYYLGHNRSFRSHINSRIIQYDYDSFSLFAEIGENRLGIERSTNAPVKIRLNSEDVSSIAKIAALLPIQLIDSQTFHLVDSGPEFRRQFIDWGVFHVEHQYVGDWKRFQRVLKQRNAAIRDKSPAKLIKIWDEEFIMLANKINEYRKTAFSQFLAVFDEIFPQLIDIQGLAIQYFPGWRESESIATLISDNFISDTRHGYTFYGPHRADIKITVDKVPAKDALSRGQQKLLVSAMRIAQGIALSNQTGKKTLYLVDDLPAELDSRRREALCELLVSLNTQVFITSIENETLSHHFNADQSQMFHVEHGKISS